MKYQHTINTTLGKFTFQWASGDKTWIAGKFLEPEKANKVYKCNPFSGKYNFHGYLNGILEPIEQLMDLLYDLKDRGRLLTPTGMPKQFYKKHGIGKAKYTVSKHDGIKTHKDGSPFFDIAIFSNKKDLNKYIKGLLADGYVNK